MTKQEILAQIIQIHNKIVQVRVCGDDTFLTGDAIRGLRYLVQMLQEELNSESPEGASDQK